MAWRGGLSQHLQNQHPTLQHWFEPWLCCFRSSSLLMGLGRQQRRSKDVGPITHTGNPDGVQAPGPAWLLRPSGKMTSRWKPVSLPVLISIALPFKINKQSFKVLCVLEGFWRVLGPMCTQALKKPQRPSKGRKGEQASGPCGSPRLLRGAPATTTGVPH